MIKSRLTHLACIMIIYQILMVQICFDEVKNMEKKLLSLFLLVVALLFTGCPSPTGSPTGSPTDLAANTAVLVAAINSANTLNDAHSVGTAIGNVSQVAKETYTAAIFAAITVRDKSSAMQGEVDAAVTTLATATAAFSAAIIDIQKILASDPAEAAMFGISVAICGDYAIVGAHQKVIGGINVGAAYIYHRIGIYTWDSGVMIVATDPEGNDCFGQSVAINGDYAIIGAASEDAGGPYAGAAYIYHRTGTNTWDTGVKIVATDAAAEDFFGASVAISGDYAIVGAFGEDAGGSNAGAAYIYHRTGTNTWDSGVKIVATDPGVADYFSKVAISGDYALVGASAKDAGAAYIYHRTGINSWDTGVKIVAADPEAEDAFGQQVAISGDYALVGAIGEDSGGSSAGAAYIYQRTGTNTWDTGVKIVATDPEAGDFFGSSVAISGDYAIVSAERKDEGAAYIYHRTGTNTWDSGVKIEATDPEAYDYFGSSVAISGDYALVGAYGEDSGGYGAGAAYIWIRL